VSGRIAHHAGHQVGHRGLWASNYRNGSYISQSAAGKVNFGEAADAETNIPLTIATFWPGNANDPTVPVAVMPRRQPA